MRKPAAIDWRYDRAELTADGVVHVTGVALALIGAVAVVWIAIEQTTATAVLGATVYALCLIATLSLSAIYNMWPVTPTKWLLRRLDHAGIFLLIAGTYTPLALQMGPEGYRFLIGVWCCAVLGMVFKVWLVGRGDKIAVLLYLALGWSGVAMSGLIAATLTDWTIVLILAGGLAYTGGVVFHLWSRLRFQNAIWHGLVLAGAATHYGAILLTVLAGPATAG